MAVRYCAQWCLLIRTCHSPKVDLHRFEVSFANSVSLEFKVFFQGGGCTNFALCLTTPLRKNLEFCALGGKVSVSQQSGLTGFKLVGGIHSSP